MMMEQHTITQYLAGQVNNFFINISWVIWSNSFFQLVISFLGPKYDTSSIQQSVISQNYKPTEFNSSRHNNGHENIPAAEMQTMDQLTIAMLSGFGNWDSVYFFHISLYGYQYEQMLAFFPFFPFLNSWIARVIKGCLFNTINMVSALYLAAIFITTTTFTVAATVLHKITSKITSDENFADLTVVMFCLNPANIFHLTAYTESTFICFQLAGICALEMMSNKSKFIISGLFFGLASATRSNGLISVGFLVCKFFQETLQELQINQSPYELIDLTFLENLLKRSLAFAMGILTAVSPFIMFQYFAYQIYCTENRPLDVFPNHWCFKTLPTSYSYIQSYYWNNGPFRYYEWKQIPNFMLAVPVIMMSYTAIWLCLAPLRVDWKTFCKSLVVKECKESRSVSLHF